MAQRAATESQADVPRLAPSRSKLAQHLDTLFGNIEVLRSAAATKADGDATEARELDDLILVLNEIIGPAMSVSRARRTREEAGATKAPSSVNQPSSVTADPSNASRDLELAAPVTN